MCCLVVNSYFINDLKKCMLLDYPPLKVNHYNKPQLGIIWPIEGFEKDLNFGSPALIILIFNSLI